MQGPRGPERSWEPVLWPRPPHAGEGGGLAPCGTLGWIRRNSEEENEEVRTGEGKGR